MRNVSGVWCVLSATHVPSVHRSQNKVLGIRVLVLCISLNSLDGFGFRNEDYDCLP